MYRKEGFENFSILFVCDVLGIQSRTDRRDFYIMCPFCRGKDKLNINIEDDVFRCNKCGVSGNALMLYAKVKDIGNSAAYAELLKIKNGDIKGYERKKVRNRNAVKRLPEKVPAKGIDERNRVYTRFLEKLVLNDSHRRNLIARGLTEEQTEKYGYRSVPEDRLKAAGELSSEYDLSGIPGFYTGKSGEPLLVSSGSGFYVPVRDMQGRISCMQIRHDNPSGGAKYTWLSSNNFTGGTGVSDIQQVHFTGFGEKETEVCITEGALKRDVASRLLKTPFIALIGVGNSSQLEGKLKELRQSGVRTVRCCFDMDRLTNENVRRAVEKNEKIIISAGFDKVYRQKWNPDYKGIDDYSLYISEKE